MRLIIKPAGLLTLVGVIAALVAVVVSRVQGQRMATPIEMGPLAAFQSKKKATGEKPALFDSKDKMAPVDLNETGSKDWIVWGLEGTKGPVRKSEGAKPISDFTFVQPDKGAIGIGKRGPSRAMFWTGGTPVGKSDVAYPGVHVSDGNGFRFSVAANKDKQTLRVYVGGYKAGGDFTAVLTDGTPVKITKDEVALEQGYYSRVYSVEFQASGPNQQLMVIWRTSSQGGNVSLQGATLE